MSPWSRLTRAWLPLLALIAAAAPAAATTRGSFDRPPFYHGKLPSWARAPEHVAVSWRGSDAPSDPSPSTSPVLAALLDSLRSELDRDRRTHLLPGGDWPMREGPDIGFGCRQGVGDETTAPTSSEVDPSEPRRMTFDIGSPGRGWIYRVTQGAGDSVRAVLVVELGFGDQWVRKTGAKGAKTLDLGTGRSTPVPWLTSIESPVRVLQLTGAVLTPAGKVLRVGAEGLLAHRPEPAPSPGGARQALAEKELASVLAPAPGGPPVWRQALRDLVSGLLEQGHR